MGRGLRSRVFGQLIQPKPGNQVSNDRRRQRRVTTDASGQRYAGQTERRPYLIL
jgi:hypothetical protein